MHSLLSLALDRLRGPSGRRTAAVVLALAVEALVLLLFLYFVSNPAKKKEPARMIVFGIDAPGEETAVAKNEARAKTRRGDPSNRPQPRAPPKPIPTPPPVVPPAPITQNFIVISRNDFAAADMARNQKPPGAQAPAASEDSGSLGIGDSDLAQGRGPHGEPLYNAEWYREPTNAELGPYMPARAMGRPGWGTIACRTVANYRVEDCQELEEAPRGSGYAGAVRQAAFQFRVRPPRRGGKPLIGSWVRIRISYTQASGEKGQSR